MLETPGFERAPLRLRLGLRFSDVVSFSGKNNSSCCRSTRTFSRRHQRSLLIVRISLQKTHVQSFLFSANSTASQVGASAWLTSTVFWACLSGVAMR